MKPDYDLPMNNIQENREKFLAVLRSPMPENFVWDFTQIYAHYGDTITCGCAVGLAYKFGWVGENLFDSVDRTADFLGLPRRVAYRILTPRDLGSIVAPRAAGYRGRHFSDVTPEMVAKKLERAFQRYPVKE